MLDWTLIRVPDKDGTTRVNGSEVRLNIKIVETPVAEVMASGLIAELDAELQHRYPGAPINGIDAAEFRAAGGCFVVARKGPLPESRE